jgi:hypothetical protein
MTVQPQIQILSDSIDRFDQLEPPLQLQEFVDKTIRGEDGAPERRENGRHSYVAKVVAIPVDKQLHPTEQPFAAYSRNISRGGIALLHVRPVRCDYLFLEIEVANKPPARVVVKVLRSRRVGRFFEIAGEFTAENGGEVKDL